MGNSTTQTLSYAIDFGTSNTVISRWNSITQQAELINLSGLSLQLGDNPPLIPSLVYVADARQGEVFLGQAVRERGFDLAGDPRFFAGFKRGIGASIQGFLPQLDQTNITFEKVGEWFLGQILLNLNAQIDENPDSLVLTVPVDSFESYRNWLTTVCQSWSVEQVKIIDEPTAAALGYGANNQEIVLVIDFGGGTLDFSLVKLNQSQGLILKWGEKLLGNNARQKAKMARVIGKAGKNLGGSDIDNWLVDYFAETEGLPRSSLINRLCERLKIELSQEEGATEVYFNDQTFESYQLSLDRKTFESILEKQQFFAQLDELMTQVLQQGRRNGIEREDIGAVLLVGGTGKIPAVQQWLRQYFDSEKIRDDRPFDAIAMGALQLVQGVKVQDFLYHSYGIRYWNHQKKTHSWHPIINNGQPYPMETPIEFILGASIENQPSIELIIGELGVETGGTEVYFEGDRLITRSLSKGETQIQPLNDQLGAKTIAKLNPLGYPGSDRIKVQFWVDEQRFLRITVEDLLTEDTLLFNQIVAQLS